MAILEKPANSWLILASCGQMWSSFKTYNFLKPIACFITIQLLLVSLHRLLRKEGKTEDQSNQIYTPLKEGYQAITLESFRQGAGCRFSD